MHVDYTPNEPPLRANLLKQMALSSIMCYDVPDPLPNGVLPLPLGFCARAGTCGGGVQALLTGERSACEAHQVGGERRASPIQVLLGARSILPPEAPLHSLTAA